MAATFIFTVMLLAVTAFGHSSLAETVSQSLYIGPDDTTYDGTDVVFDGSITVTISGSHSFSTLTLSGGAVLTHLRWRRPHTPDLELQVGRVVIDSSSRIDLTGKGWGPSPEQTASAGGSYGGLGGGRSGWVTNPVYGDPRRPAEFGTGGIGNTGGTSYGGGALKLIADEVQLEGEIVANGINTWYGGGGSGGSVWLDVGVLSGSGQIHADGADGGGNGTTGGGGGGRVAIYYDTLSGFEPHSQVTAYGGAAHGQSPIEGGGAGTVYLQARSAAKGELRIANSGAGTEDAGTPLGGALNEPLVVRSARVRLADGTVLESVDADSGSQIIPEGSWSTTSGDLRVDGWTLLVRDPQSWKTLELVNGAVARSIGMAHAVSLRATRVVVDASSRIDVSGQGAGPRAGQTGKAGGSYGGLGGIVSGWTTNAVYGDLRQPVDFGTGGQGYTPTRGGGALKLVVDELQLDGQIRADGGADHYGAGGSGGSVWLEVGVLSGAGQVQANGASGGTYSDTGGGGGGRVAIYYDSVSGFDPQGQVSAYGGGGRGSAKGGGAGTIYTRARSAATGTLRIANATVGTQGGGTPIGGALNEPLVVRSARVHLADGTVLESVDADSGCQIIPEGSWSTTSGDLRVDGWTLLVRDPQSWKTLELVNGAVARSIGMAHAVSLRATRVVVDASSRIDVSGQGAGPRAGQTGKAGGSYGGLGGIVSGWTTNAVYGDLRQPVDFGTGGQGYTPTRGGGALKLVVDELQLDGQIRADGGADHYGAGGSGGSVWLEVGVLSGAGQVQANGASGGTYSDTGGGGGGRVAIYYGGTTGFDLQARVLASGGKGAGSAGGGQEGTIFLNDNHQPIYVLSDSLEPLYSDSLNSFELRFSAAIDASSFAPADVRLDTPGGTVSPSTIEKLDDTHFRLHFDPPLSTDGDYQVSIGPEVSTPLGSGMDQDRDGTVGEVPDDVYTASFKIDHSAPPQNGLVAYYTFDGDTKDHSGNKRDGSAYGNPVFVPGPTGQAIHLDGVGDYVQVPLDSVLKFDPNAHSFTLSAWIRPARVNDTDGGSGSNCLLKAAPVIDAYRYRLNNGGIDVKRDGSAQGGAGVGAVWDTAQWHLFTGIWQVAGSTATALYYVDGHLLETKSFPVVNGGSYPYYGLYLGATRHCTSGGLSYGEMDLDEVRIYDRALSPDEVQKTYQYLTNLVDRTAPATPVLDPLPESTNVNQHEITGSKDVNSSIWLGGERVVSYTGDSTWSYTAPLTEGDNSFTFTSQDLAGNESGPVTAKIRYDNTAPAAVLVVADGEGDGTRIELDWSAYDEVANGNDIDHYAVYALSEYFTSPSPGYLVGTVPAGTKRFSMTGLTRNSTYYVAVVAVDSAGNQQSSFEPTAALTEDIVAPEDASALTASALADALDVSWQASADSAGDLAEYHLYRDNEPVATIPKGTLSYHLGGLTAATSYALRLTAVDADDNESAGVEITAATLLDNPTGVTVEPYSGQVALSWTAAQPTALVKHYAIYASETDFTSVTGMTPRLLVSGGQTGAKLAALTNNTKYYFAVTTINISDGEREAVTTVSATPTEDKTGPDISDLRFDGGVLAPGATLTQAGDITVAASDPSGVGRVEFLVDGALLATDAGGGWQYKAHWEIVDVPDGAHTLTIKAYDTLDNVSTHDVAVTIALAPPPAPTIAKPQNGTLTNSTTVTVSGTAEAQTEVLLYDNGAVTGDPLPVSSTGTFSATLTLNEGENRLQASARNRGGEGPLSAETLVTIDTSIPDAPTGLVASARRDGVVRLSWSRSLDSNVVGYHVYRASAPFETIDQASRANSNRVTATSFDDLPPSDTTWYYRVVAVNRLNTVSEPSAQVFAPADSTPPRATEIVYTPSGQYDAASGRMAPGQVQVQVIVSEPLLTTPFLSITPSGGIPIALSLTRVNDTEYRGSFEITELTPSGTAYAVFSARDRVGNRGTDVDAGATLEIDTQGPSVQDVSISPAEPVRNDQNNPVTINFALVLDEPLAAGTTPTLSYQLSGANRSAVPIDGLVQTDQRNWQGSFMLPADAGLAEVENLSFVYSGADDLGNTSTKVLGDNAFQVYQGDLPPLAAPTGLKALALPGGQVKLTWNPVDGAVAYQLYRQAAGETALIAYQRATEAQFVDTTAQDGEYRYAVASVRSENAQEAISGQSEPVTVVADSVAPPAPTNLSLELVSTGIVARWEAPAANEPLTYSLYRAAGDITALDGLASVRSGVDKLEALDPSPSETEHTYAVVAVDAAGNMSAPSASAYLNFDLLPVSTLSVVQTDAEKPLVSWMHPGTTISGYDLYLGDGAAKLKLNTTLLDATSYTDSGYSGDERLYTVVAVDTNGAESVGRSLLLPKLTADLAAGSTLKRGIMNQLDYTVRNDSSRRVDGARLHVSVAGHAHVSTSFGLDAGASLTVPVIVGGYADLPDVAPLATAAVIVPNPGERVRIERHSEISVGDGALVLSLASKDFTRGGAGQVQFTLENTSAVDTEIVLATANGAKPSNQVRLKLVDADGNVLTARALLQDVGTDVVRLANGTTVARVPAGASFTSDWFDLPVPSSAPDAVSVQLEVDKFHYHLGREDHVAIAGLTVRRDTPLVDTTYYGALDDISPKSSLGDQDILITGHAVVRSSGEPMPSVPLTLVLAANGFERKFEIYTDATGGFTHRFTPLSGESGVYKVSVVHPDVLDRPAQGEFTINRVTFNPTTLNVNIPRDYDQHLSIGVKAGGGTTASNVRLVYEAADQPSGTLPDGVQVDTDGTLNLGSGQSGQLNVTLRGGDTAADTGALVLKALSDESGSKTLALIHVNYAFSEAAPALYYTPSYIETGVSQGGSVSESVTLENRGLAPLEGTTVKLVQPDGSAPPSWLYLTAAEDQGSLAVGEKRSVGFVAAPTDSVSDGIYEYRLRVSASNHPTRDINVFVAVTQSGVGSVLFKASDIYTATLDADGNPILGLQGARIYVQNEQVLSVDATLTTDAAGEALFKDLPSGWYKFRATATNHQEVRGRFQIKPGITLAKDVFLDYDLVTVEWSVTEITIQDKYDVTLNATYETQVPAAVVVADPSSVNLPNMAKGDVFYGEFTLTNYGLIRADHLQVNLPPPDEYVRYELMDGIPTSLGAQERVVAAFRAVALKAFDPATDGNATGGGCSAYSACFNVHYDYACANGTVTNGAASFCTLYTFGCTTTSGSTTSSGGTSTINFVGGSGGGSYSPTYQSISGAQCVPKPKECPTCKAAGHGPAGGSGSGFPFPNTGFPGVGSPDKWPSLPEFGGGSPPPGGVSLL